MNTPRRGLATSLSESAAGSIPIMVVLAAVGLISLVAIVRRHGLLWAVPYLIGSGILAAMGLLGAAFLPGIADHGPGYLHNHAFPILLTLSIFITAASMFAVGSLFGLGSRPTTLQSRAEAAFTGFAPKTADRRGGIVRISLIAAWSAALMIVLGVGGPAAVLQRGGYLQYSGIRVLMSIGNLLELVAAALVGFASVVANPRQRMWCRVAVVVIGVLAFSTGSRRLGLVPMLYWFGGFLARPSKRRVAVLPIAALLAFTFTGMALTARQQPLSGLDPYLTYFLTHPSSIFTASASQTANALAPFAFVAYAAVGVPPSSHDIYVSLSPEPSGWVHWYAISDHFLFFARHPLPTLGTLYRWHGLGAVAVYMFIGGVILGMAGRLARRLTASRALSIGTVMISTIAAYFCLKCTQYQLRTNSRILWYALATVFVFGLLSVPGSLLRTSEGRARSPGPTRRPPQVRTTPALPAKSGGVTS